MLTCREFCSLLATNLVEEGYDVQDLRYDIAKGGGDTNQKEHEEENPTEPGGDQPRTVADTFHH